MTSFFAVAFLKNNILHHHTKPVKVQDRLILIDRGIDRIVSIIIFRESNSCTLDVNHCYGKYSAVCITSHIAVTVSNNIFS